MSLLLAAILPSLGVVDTGLAAVTGGAAHTVHGTTEADGVVGLVFFQEATGAGAEPVGAVIPAATFHDPGFVADQGGLSVSVCDSGDRGVTIQEVDHVTFL